MSIPINPSYHFLNSNEVAADRLRMIVRSDREAVPCGRWVHKNPAPSDAEGAVYWHAICSEMGSPRPRYRWEIRR